MIHQIYDRGDTRAMYKIYKINKINKIYKNVEMYKKLRIFDVRRYIYSSIIYIKWYEQIVAVQRKEFKHMCWPHNLRNDVRGQDVVKEKALARTS